MQKLFLVSSHTAVVASALLCRPQVTGKVLMWPTEQGELETPGSKGTFLSPAEHV